MPVEAIITISYKENEMERNFEVKDMYLAAYLYAEKIPFVEAHYDGRVVWFSFAEYANCKSMAQEFWANNAVVKVKEYSEALRAIKDIIIEHKGAPAKY
jgi:hypothetical protein